MIKIGRTKKGCSAVVAYPGFGYRMGDGRWRIHVAGAVWQEPVVFNRRQKWMIRMLGNAMKATQGDLESAIFQNRITPFMAESVARRPVSVEISGESRTLRRKTRKNGHYRDFFSFPDEIVSPVSRTDEFGNRVVGYRVRPVSREDCSAEGQVYLLEHAGVSVISDIDDTIKDSGVGDRRELLANTFLRDFRSVDGMADIYRSWSQAGASFHYVSSSPWQLYDALQDLCCSSRFPSGTIHLRNFRLRDQVLDKVMVRRQGKATAIRLLMKSLPGRKFILVGDSGEKDPEIYRKICRKYPGQVVGLFIRNVAHRPLDDERRQKLKESVGAGRFGTFDHAGELAVLSRGIFPASQA